MNAPGPIAPKPQERPRRSRQLPRWVLALLVALALQALLLGLLYLALENPFPTAADRASELLTFEEELLPEAPVELKEKAEPPLKEIPGTEQPVGQLVDLPRPEHEELPEQASWSARYAMKVKEEVKARLLGPTLRAPVDADRAEAKGKGDEQPVAHQDPGQEAVPRQPAQAAEGLEPPKPKGGSQSVATRDALREGFGPAALGRDPFDNVKTMGRRDASDDSLPRVGAGEDESALNAMPYRYIGFFERVKDAVRREWDPNAAYGPRDPTGAAFGYKDRMTVLKVVLDRRGKLLDAVVVSSCGLGFLDDEAKRAMWAASPYANPPEGLVGDDGRIKFEFGFVFLLSSARHKLFWRLQ